MSIGVSTEFIDLTDNEWHILPSNAINIVFEIDKAGASADSSVDILTAHTPSSKNHTLDTINTNAANSKKSHLELEAATHKFVLQNVKADGTIATGSTVRVYFGRSR